MSYITSIFQAIFQAITEIFPISESGHSAIFHDFSGRLSGTCSQLTGTIHIGISLGIIIVFWKLFANEIISFFRVITDLFGRRLDRNNISGSEKFTLSTLVSFVPFLLFLIPCGKDKNLLIMLTSTSYNGNLLGEGIWFIVLALLVFGCARQLSLKRNTKQISYPFALILGLVAMISVSFAGLSTVGVVFSIAVIFGISKNVAIRYTFALMLPITLTKGILELVLGVTKIAILPAIISVFVAACVTYFAIKLLIWMINCKKMNSIGFYNLSIGVITTITGLIQLIVR